MNQAAMDYIASHKDKLTGRVIEIGSLNVNGTVRDVIKVEVGVDLRKGKCVDLVCPVENLLEHYEPETFDACVSSGSLEHIEDWKGFARVTWALVKEGGWLVITMASTHKGRHAYPDDYWRMEESHVKQIWPNYDNYTDIDRVSIGWVVQKTGELGDIDKVSPIVVP